MNTWLVVKEIDCLISLGVFAAIVGIAAVYFWVDAWKAKRRARRAIYTGPDDESGQDFMP